MKNPISCFLITILMLLFISGCKETFGPRIETKISKVRSDFKLIESINLNSLPMQPVTLFDPFGDTYKFTGDNGRLILYSIGPDKHDDLGQLTYDPSNGLVSDGDLLLIIRNSENSGTDYVF